MRCLDATMRCVQALIKVCELTRALLDALYEHVRFLLPKTPEIPSKPFLGLRHSHMGASPSNHGRLIKGLQMRRCGSCAPVGPCPSDKHRLSAWPASRRATSWQTPRPTRCCPAWWRSPATARCDLPQSHIEISRAALRSFRLHPGAGTASQTTDASRPRLLYSLW